MEVMRSNVFKQLPGSPEQKNFSNLTGFFALLYKIDRRTKKNKNNDENQKSNDHADKTI